MPHFWPSDIFKQFNSLSECIWDSFPSSSQSCGANEKKTTQQPRRPKSSHKKAKKKN